MIRLIVRASPWKIGGYLAHVGVALMLMGIIGSTAYKQVQVLTVDQGGATEALGYTFQFQGLEQLADDKWAAQLLVRKGSEMFIATPKLLPTDQGMVRNPYIHKYPLEDLYISPGDYSQGGTDAVLVDIIKGQTQEAEGYAFKFVDFVRSGHDTAASQAATMGAILEVTRDGQTTVITPTLTVDPQKGTTQAPVDLPGGTLQIVFDGADLEQKIVGLAITDKAAPVQQRAPSISLEVSKQPLINVLWAGLILMAIGTFLAVVRRRREQERALAPVGPAAAAQPAPSRKGRKSRR